MRHLYLFVAAVTAFAIAALTQPTQTMYHPTMGRFLQRDPSGYADGISLYEYVGGSPCCYLDPSGLAEVVITVLPGYYKKELGNPGQTRWAARVTGLCNCPKGETTWKLANAKAEIQVAITVDTRRIRGTDAAGAPMTIEGVVGHEQKHVRQAQTEISSLKPTIQTRLEEIEKPAYETYKLCMTALINVRTEIYGKISVAAKAAMKHANSEEEEAAGAPKERTQYPPEPGSDTSSKGTPNPVREKTETFLPWEPQEKGELPWKTNPRDPSPW